MLPACPGNRGTTNRTARRSRSQIVLVVVLVLETGEIEDEDEDENENGYFAQEDKTVHDSSAKSSAAKNAKARKGFLPLRLNFSQLSTINHQPTGNRR